MDNYNLGILCPYEFQDLILDLLQKDRKIQLESFRPGPDSGIDIKGTIESGDWIIQCKHYINSSFSILFRELKKEKEKVEKINPSKYSVVTSFSATNKNKQKINELFSDLNSFEFLSKENIMQLLDQNEDIVRKNYKLWFTSSTIFLKLLNNKIYNNTEFDIYNFLDNLKKIVITEDLNNSIQILDKKNICIICGMPGIGKSTLMRSLVLNYIDKGYEPIQISNSIDEAFEVYFPEKKQIFYFDDFLGRSFLDKTFKKNEETELLNFLNRFKKLQNKKIILATREYILNQAKELSETVSNFDSNQYVLKLENYSTKNKALILYNHLWHSNITNDNIVKLISNKKYWEIIQHKNFNPRIIEWMTLDKNVDDNNFVENFLYSLNNPEKIWKFAFENEIRKSSQIILMILATFKRDVSEDLLTTGYINYCKKNCVYIDELNIVSTYNKGIRELEGTFIRHSIEYGNNLYIEFHNPSIYDFVINYIFDNYCLLPLIIQSLVQIQQANFISNLILNSNLTTDIKNSLFKDILSFTYCFLDILYTKSDFKFGETFEDGFLLFLKIILKFENLQNEDIFYKYSQLLIKRILNKKSRDYELFDIISLLHANKDVLVFNWEEFSKAIKINFLSDLPSSFTYIIKHIQAFKILDLDPNSSEFNPFINHVKTMILNGIEIDQEQHIYTYNPNEGCYDHNGNYLDDYETIVNDIDIIINLLNYNPDDFEYNVIGLEYLYDNSITIDDKIIEFSPKENKINIDEIDLHFSELLVNRPKL